MSADLIHEVTDKLEELFLEFRKWHGELEPVMAKDYEQAKAHVDKRYHELKACSEGPQQSELSAREEVRRINRQISDEFNRLNAGNYVDNAESSLAMYQMLSRLSRAYSIANRVRSADPLIRYMLTSIEHTWWYWSEWLKSCLFQQDFTSAECMLKAAQDMTEFAEATRGHAHWLCAKALIHELRDEDRELALHYANIARSEFGDVQEAVDLWRKLTDLTKNPGTRKPEISHHSEMCQTLGYDPGGEG